MYVIDKKYYICYITYMIQKSVVMTSKGTFTLPATVRKALGLTKAGDKLMLTFHEQSSVVELKKAPDFAAIQEEIAQLLPANAPPLELKKIREQRHQERQK
ncbi:MAG: hypothetical protein JWN38_61 [Candidatus Saccharibacteria bacterium]|nr:hypothetical protein [Candidatus Saccharibacteria bacterium]